MSTCKQQKNRKLSPNRFQKNRKLSPNRFYSFQVCDDQWHHYAVNVRFPDVELYLDGQLFRSEKKNPEVIDDWPLHPTKGINTTLTVGACWQVNISYKTFYKFL